MSNKEVSKRYLFFLVGLFVNSLGVSFITKGGLGTSPISSIPYTFSIGFWPTLGQFTFVFNMFLIILQLILAGKKFPKQYWLQIPVVVLFSYFIDLTMKQLFFINSDIYFIKFIYLIIGCVILGFGVFMEIVANVVMLPGEAFVNIVSGKFHFDFGKTKVVFDSSMTIIAGILGVILYHKLAGVREGTIVAAILVGMIARFFKRKIGFIEKYLKDADMVDSTAVATSNASTKQQNQKNDKGVIITINREYGSGGHQVGEKLAQQLGFEFYDRNIIELAVGEGNMTEAYINRNEQKLNNPLLYDLMAQYYLISEEETPEDKLYEVEKNIIKKAADVGNCVIVGRCSDYILRDYKNCINVFLYANEEYKVQQIRERENLSYDKALKHVRKINKQRFLHYKYYTGQLWGYSKNYNICINTGKTGIEKTVQLIQTYLVNENQK